MDLKKLGWDDHLEKVFSPLKSVGYSVGRVTIENRDRYQIVTEIGECPAEVTGKFMFSADSAAQFPKVGDWVAVTMFDAEQKAIIHEVLPRKTKFSRKAPGKGFEEQVIAANLDVIFIVQSLDENYNLRRLERYLVMVHENRVQPIVVLNKTDLCPEYEDRLTAVRNLMPDLTVVAVSAKTNSGLETLRSLIKAEWTFAFIGSSGVGKSSLINQLAGEEIFKTAEVREIDSRGRHTTTRRQLIVLPTGGCLIDTPGMRELQLWQAEEGMDETFADIDRISTDCHFSDCTHTSEIKCAVLAAVASGELPQGRYQNYLKMRKELAHLETTINKESFLERKRKDKILHREINRI
ncbi:MAG TPA: ribosome small subunit-dependent GTPase A, partial [bacterium]